MTPQMHTCYRCREYGLFFERPCAPTEFLEGRRSSRISIVGLNPKGPPGTNPPRTVEDLEAHFSGSHRHRQVLLRHLVLQGRTAYRHSDRNHPVPFLNQGPDPIPAD